jgi:hypothetical protein
VWSVGVLGAAVSVSWILNCPLSAHCTNTVSQPAAYPVADSAVRTRIETTEDATWDRGDLDPTESAQYPLHGAIIDDHDVALTGREA